MLPRTGLRLVTLGGIELPSGNYYSPSTALAAHVRITTRGDNLSTCLAAEVPAPAASLGGMTALLSLDPDQLLSTTRAVRKRLDFSQPVPGQLIRECVALAPQAPSGSNLVTMRFVVVRDEQKRQEIGEIYRQVYAGYEASPAYPGNATGEAERDSAQRRVASSADYLGEHMGDAPVLVLGTAWTSMHRAREQDVADVLGIPYDRVAQAVLTPLAYTRGTDFKPAARPDPDTVIHRDGW